MQTLASPLSPLPPLPSALEPAAGPAGGPARRHAVGNLALDDCSMQPFNALLERLHHPPLACDQLATAARDLYRQYGDPCPDPIARRLAIARQIDRMLGDSDWSPGLDAIEPARLVVDYLCGEHGLIPPGVPVVGHLDDAIVVDAAWPYLAAEIESYLDFCRLRATEASLNGGTGPAHFSRADWLRARRDEAGLIAHCKRVGASSYLSDTASAWFLVH